MAPLEWKDSYSVGVEAVDHEHRELIDLVNRLHQALEGGADVEHVFGDLFRSISAHFALEERFMREHGYDQVTQHKADHERLLDQLRDIMDDYREGGADPAGRERWRARWAARKPGCGVRSSSQRRTISPRAAS